MKDGPVRPLLTDFPVLCRSNRKAYPEKDLVASMVHVLYVDDEPAILDLGAILLKKFGKFDVKTASSGLEALDYLHQDTYEAVISDYQMPGMNGIELLQKVRSQFGNIPFILYTGRGRQDVVIEALNSGADYYFEKGGDPIPQFMEMRDTLESCINRIALEKEVSEAEKQHRFILDHLPIGVWQEDYGQVLHALSSLKADGIIDPEKYMTENPGAVYDLFGLITPCYTNPETREIFGVDSPDEFSHRFRDSFWSAYPEIMKNLLVSLARGDLPFPIREMYHYLGGHHVFLTIVWTDTLKNGVHQIISYGFAREVTHLKKTEHALWESDTRLDFALKAAGLGYWEKDLLTGRVRYNSVWTEILGLEPGEVFDPGRWWRAQVHPDDLGKVLLAHREFFQNRIPEYDVVFRMKHKDGDWRWIRTRGKIILYEPGGKPARFLGINQEIHAP